MLRTSGQDKKDKSRKTARADGGLRSHDLHFTRVALYQLSYVGAEVRRPHALRQRPAGTTSAPTGELGRSSSVKARSCALAAGGRCRLDDRGSRLQIDKRAARVQEGISSGGDRNRTCVDAG